MKECFGNIYPPVDSNSSQKVFTGKVFSVNISPLGTWGNKEIKWNYNLDEWNACQSCEHFTNCYQLSNSKAIMQLLLPFYK